MTRARAWLAVVVAVLVAGCGTEERRLPVAEVPALADVPLPPLAVVDEAVRQQLRGQFKRAEILQKRADTSRSTLGAAFGDLGRHLEAYGFDSHAVVAYENATLLVPDEFRWWYHLGALREDLGRFEPAREALERSRTLRPRDVPTLVHLTSIEWRADDLERASALAMLVLEIAPRSAPALYLSGQIAAARGDHAAAAAAFEKAVTLQPLASRVRYPLANAYVRLGRRDEARAQLERRGKQPPTLADPLRQELRDLVRGAGSLLFRGSEEMKKGSFAAAAESFRAATKADPENAVARLNLGAALAQSGRYEEAVPELEAALALGLPDASRSKASFNLGVLYEMKGRLAEAGEQFRAAVEWSSANRLAVQRLEALESAGSR